ncbi:hypothetical protein ACQJBY_027826 [Aegilops geniculata]
MLKNYDPPRCPVHMFMRKYMRLLFDRESEENYEKRTRIGRPVLGANMAIERHAGKIYARAMFEQFGHILYECDTYIDANRREKWFRTSYKVTVLDGGEEFDCDSGQSAHMGLLCSRVLKVLDFMCVTEIPKKHILKRWTRDARDILPLHLSQYQRDHAQENSFSFRRFKMYMHAKLVQMGDSSVEAYEHQINMFKHCAAEMKPFTEMRDGLGLEDRLAENGDVFNRVHSKDTT